MLAGQSALLSATIRSRNSTTRGRSVIVSAGLLGLAAVGPLAFYVGVAPAAVTLGVLSVAVLAFVIANRPSLGPDASDLGGDRPDVTLPNPRTGEAGAYFPAN